MSYWSHTSSGAPGDTRPPYTNAPPLPPRNTGPDAVPPPIPPRPVGFGHQSVRNSGILDPPNQTNGLLAGVQWVPISSNTSPGDQSATPRTPDGHIVVLGQVAPERDGPHQYPSSHAGIPQIQAQGYSDISHLFPGGRVPPPPPRPVSRGVSASPQPPSNASMSVSPAVLQPQFSAYDGFPSTYDQPQSQPKQSFSTQAMPVSGDSRQHIHTVEDSTTVTKTHNVNSNSVGESSMSQEVTRLTVNNDMAAVNETFQALQLASSSESVPPSRKDANSNTYRAYSPPKPSSSVPPIPEKVPLQTIASPGVRSPPADLPATHLRQSQAVYKECLAGGSTFAATWYTHHRAPKFPICPYCYETHIRGSRFAAEFRGSFCDDGEARACGFSGPRMKESLWNLALSSGSLDCVVEYMTLRPSIQDCVGAGGAKGDAGIKWYRAKNYAIPAMVVCQACYEDHILSHPRFGEEHFEPNTIEHAADQVWACDIALPYIYRDYMVRAATNDWPAFVEGVTARLSMPPCPGTKTVYPSTRKWFTPTNGPQGLLICATCYCDYILLTGQDGTWRDAGDNLVAIFGASVACDFGAQFNLRMLAARTLETRDHALFWKGVEAVAREPTCGARMQGATWYTLRSDPAGFEICGACYASLVESTGVAHHFMRKAAPAAGTPDSGGITCSFNPAVARFGAYMKNFQELVSTQDPGPLEAFVRVYAFMPTCRRDTHLENARWFGWNECTICPECYHEFVRGTALAEAMAPESVLVERGLMCEMYSPRMRQLVSTSSSCFLRVWARSR